MSMRNATAYGASPRLRLDIVLNNLVGWAHTTGAINLQSDGTAWRPLVHIRDIAAAAIALLDAPAERSPGMRSISARPSRTTAIRDLADVVAAGDARVRGDVRGRRRRRPSEATASTSASSSGHSPI